MNLRRWDAQIRRAGALLARHAFAGEALRFFRVVTQFQKSLYEEVEKSRKAALQSLTANAFSEPPDFFLLLPRFDAFLSLITSHAPPALAQAAEAMRTESPEHNRDLLQRFWLDAAAAQNNLTPTDALLAWVFLQPYAVSLAERVPHQDVGAAPFTCPICGRKPIAGVLRPEGDGAKRSLVCMLCAHEWNFRRIVCPACGEEDVHKLAVYSSDAFPHVRVEACDTCKAYIKTVDLTKDGHAVPVVDELATIPLNLWATEHGYTKLQSNLIGI